jgi:predicted transcriptional regulator
LKGITTMTAMPEPRHDLANDADPQLEAAIARGRADVKAGRVVDHAEVRAWALSLATDNPLPRPQPRCE